MAGIVRVTCIRNGHLGDILVGDGEGTEQEQIKEAIKNATCKDCGSAVKLTTLTD